MKRTIESTPHDIESISKTYHTQSQKLRRAYKENISDYNEFYKVHKDMFDNEAFVFPEKIGENMGIDETGIINGKLYTILYNKDRKGKKGSLAAIIKGTKSSVVTDAIRKYVPFNSLVGIKEITLDLANSMDWISRQIAPNAIRTYDRFHVETIVTEAMQQVRIKLRWEAIERENQLRANKDVIRLKRYSNGDSEKQLLARSWNPGANIGESKEYLVILNKPYTEDLSSIIEYTGTSRKAADIANGYLLSSSEYVIPDSIRAIARSPWFNALYVVGFSTPTYQPGFNPTGTLTIEPSMVLSENDKYYFKVKKEKTADEKKAQFDKINVYPNPLFGYNSSSSAFGFSNDEPFVTFSNLPEEVNIKIYSLSGILIKTISKNDLSASSRWDLKNESGMRIASGMYLAIVNVPNIGQKIIKFAIIQPQKRVHYE